MDGDGFGGSGRCLEAATQTPTPGGGECGGGGGGGFWLETLDHCKVALASIRKMQQNEQLCDVTLHIGLDQFRAHRVILAAASPYFFAMFNGDLKEHNLNEIRIHGVDGVGAGLLLEYAYSGELLITTDNVQVLLPASGVFQMDQVREACCRFLLKQLDPTNCLGIRSFADAHSCKELYRSAHIYALQNFQLVMSTEEFLLLPFAEVHALISNSQLNIAAEEDVFIAVLNWVKHDLSARAQHIASLMAHVRLPLVNRDFLMTHVDSEVLMRDSHECREFLLEAMRYHLAPERRCALTTPRTVERKPEGATPYLFACGGGSLFSIHAECEVYNPMTSQWHQMAPMAWRRSRAGVTSLRRHLYVVGGYDGATDLSTVECYNPLVNRWHQVTAMGTKRSCLGICTHDGLIYVCGGYDGASCLNSVERFDPLTGVWSSCPPMVTRRRYCRVAVVENCIYAIGGFDSTNYQASIEKFDPRTGHWMALPSMVTKRSSCGVAVLDSNIYCIGGNDGTMCMASGEVFDVRRNGWDTVTAMHNKRATHEIVTVTNHLYALGGNDGSSSLNSVERYDAHTRKWDVLTSMLIRRSSVGAAMLDCIHLEEVMSHTTAPTTTTTTNTNTTTNAIYTPASIVATYHHPS